MKKAKSVYLLLVCTALLFSGCGSSAVKGDEKDRVYRESIFPPETLERIENPVRDDELEITYVANHGFLFKADGKSILIDSIISPASGQKALYDELELMMNNRLSPFENVELMLVTHNHSDHFNFNRIQSFLNANSQCSLVATSGIAKSMKDAMDNTESEITGVNPGKNKISEITVNGNDLKVIGLNHHLDTDIEHIAFIFEMNGLKIAHLGDAGKFPSPYRYLEFENENIDILIAPFGSECSNWLVAQNGNGIETIRKHIKPKCIIMGHLPAEYSQAMLDSSYKNLKSKFPDTQIIMMHPENMSQYIFSIEDGKLLSKQKS